ncbi:putative autotransporter adhesin-like protein [Pseudoduganella flava]|uniref:DUF2807 domain-containing protein n=1 Tax=Pseudoduganella flava TaxID=871742 RepID=A0A562PJ86_9BURK|nr:head GIN domain-containing protein [Pseudoduganella flava]QGZ42059.1 DUF2807 domain-containing protein [Pseudoduganella flava]TWI44487.1 putative autotransporter adhesin-like protein [Pseudoduganella flava]
MNLKPLALVTTTLLAAATLVAAVPAAAEGPSLAWLVGGERVKGSGHVVSQARQPGAFHGVELALPARVEVRTGGDDTLTLEGDDNILPLIETVVEKGVLTIRPTKKNLQLEGRKVTIVVQARNVDNLGVAGSGSMEAKGIRADKLSLEVAGSGVLDASAIEAKSVDLAVAGSGKVMAAGQAQSAEVSVAGSGKADASRLTVQQATASVSGSGHAQVSARQSLTANVTGSGGVGYYGDPQVTKAVAGSGSVRRLGGVQ